MLNIVEAPAVIVIDEPLSRFALIRSTAVLEGASIAVTYEWSGYPTSVCVESFAGEDAAAEQMLVILRWFREREADGYKVTVP